MSVNTGRIDRSFSTTEMQDLTTAFQTVDTVFDFHQGASPLDVMRMLKIGTNNRRFIQEIKTAVDHFPFLLPGYVTQAQFNDAYDLWFQLDDMEAYLESLLSRVSQTKLIDGNHLMRDCLDVYNSMQKAVHRGISGVNPYLVSAERRFENLGNYTSDAEDGSGPGDGGAGTSQDGGSSDDGGQGGAGSQDGSGSQTGTGGSGTQDGSNNDGGSGGQDDNDGGQGMASDNDPASTSGSTQDGGGSSSDQGGVVNP